MAGMSGRQSRRGGGGRVQNRRLANMSAGELATARRVPKPKLTPVERAARQAEYAKRRRKE